MPRTTSPTAPATGAAASRWACRGASAARMRSGGRPASQCENLRQKDLGYEYRRIMQPEKRATRPHDVRHSNDVRTHPPMQFVMHADFSLAQRKAAYARIGEQSRPKRAASQPCHAAPRSVQILRTKHRMREHDGCLAAAQ